MSRPTKRGSRILTAAGEKGKLPHGQAQASAGSHAAVEPGRVMSKRPEIQNG